MPSTLIESVFPDARLNVSADTKRFTMSFIEPGPISYREMKNGTIELLRKPVIDAAIQALVGQPVTVGHPTKWRTESDIKEWARMNSVGTIEKSVTYNAEDGWYHAEGALTKPEAVRENSAPSPVFFARGYGSSGKFHGIPYGRELLAIEFDHIGLVPNPRFECATARFNSNSEPMNIIKTIKSIFTKQKNAEGVEVDVRVNEEGEIPADAKVDLGNGVTVPLSELVANHTARLNAAAKNITLEPDTEIVVGDSKIKLSDLVAGETAARLNAAEVETAKKKKDEEEAAALAAKAKEGSEYFVRLNAAKAHAAKDPFEGKTPDKTPPLQREAARVNKLFGPPGKTATT